MPGAVEGLDRALSAAHGATAELSHVTIDQTRHSSVSLSVRCKKKSVACSVNMVINVIISQMFRNLTLNLT